MKAPFHLVPNNKLSNLESFHWVFRTKFSADTMILRTKLNRSDRNWTSFSLYQVYCCLTLFDCTRARSGTVVLACILRTINSHLTLSQTENRIFAEIRGRLCAIAESIAAYFLFCLCFFPRTSHAKYLRFSFSRCLCYCAISVKRMEKSRNSDSFTRWARINDQMMIKTEIFSPKSHGARSDSSLLYSIIM